MRVQRKISTIVKFYLHNKTLVALEVAGQYDEKRGEPLATLSVDQDTQWFVLLWAMQHHNSYYPNVLLDRIRDAKR